jgi:hypothetical protein
MDDGGPGFGQVIMSVNVRAPLSSRGNVCVRVGGAGCGSLSQMRKLGEIIRLGPGTLSR